MQSKGRSPLAFMRAFLSTLLCALLCNFEAKFIGAITRHLQIDAISRSKNAPVETVTKNVDFNIHSIVVACSSNFEFNMLPFAYEN
jgi:hypothetical protein